jgi:hypothetical protein
MDDRTAVLGVLAEEFYGMFLGAETELRCFDAVSDSSLMPEWYWGMREATPEEDYAGYDCFFCTDVGEAQVQIKSSDAEAEKFAWRNPKSGILILVIRFHMSPEEIRQYVVFRLTQWRRQRLARMRAWKPHWTSILAYSHSYVR